VQGRYVLVMLAGTSREWVGAMHGYETEQAASADVDRLVTSADVPMDTLLACVDMGTLDVIWTQRAMRIASNN
jgi:hypothetical protein